MADGFAEIDDVHLDSPDGGALFAVVSGDVGWLMYLRHSDGDAGFSSLNPDYDGDPTATREFVAGGQPAPFPLAWCYPTDVIRRALNAFAESGRPPTFIQWHNDSGDGEEIDGPGRRARTSWHRDHRR